MSDFTNLETVLTAEQFVAWVVPSVVNEAVFTDENNETRTLADYLADLGSLCERLVTREIEITS